MFRRMLLPALLTGVFLLGLSAEVVQACPMCKNATETDSYQPRAYMYSILFMLAVPATIFGSLGFGLYRMNKSEKTALDELEEFEQNHRLE